MAGADNLFLAYLPLMRAQLDRMGHTLEDVIMGLDHVERTVAGYPGQLAGINAKLDRLDAQITRIEKRLDIVEG